MWWTWLYGAWWWLWVNVVGSVFLVLLIITDCVTSELYFPSTCISKGRLPLVLGSTQACYTWIKFNSIQLINAKSGRPNIIIKKLVDLAIGHTRVIIWFFRITGICVNMDLSANSFITNNFTPKLLMSRGGFWMRSRNDKDCWRKLTMSLSRF